MYDICCIGHITLDKVVTPKSTVHMAGGTSFYFANAIQNLDLDFVLVTALAKSELHFVEELRSKGIEVRVQPSAETVYFENIYSDNSDHRKQRVLQVADSFSVEEVMNVDARIYHLGPLLAGDMSVDLIKALSAKGMISLDVQGYLRKVQNQQVCAIDWRDKKKALRHIDILKASGSEMEVLTGQKEIHKGARILADYGVKEVIITMGSMGSVIYKDGVYYDVPAYWPVSVIDATGCGDTYMAGYLYQRIKGAGLQEAGEFGAAMATLKIESSGPFTGTEQDVMELLANSKTRMIISA